MAWQENAVADGRTGDGANESHAETQRLLAVAIHDPVNIGRRRTRRHYRSSAPDARLFTLFAAPARVTEPPASSRQSRR